jgi:hypothetical protein
MDHKAKKNISEKVNLQVQSLDKDYRLSIDSEAIASLETELPVGKTSALTHLDKAKAIRDSLATRKFNPDDIEQFKRSGRS